MSNRISHYFFTNNTPTGVNYTSPILSSVVYHDGAEYPYLPRLPFYNGQALDKLSNLGFVGGCTDIFNRVARGHEQNLVIEKSAANLNICGRLALALAAAARPW